MASSTGNATSVEFGDRKRKKYQDESTKVSMVSVSRLAGIAHLGQATFTQSVAPPSGEVPFGLRSSPSADGNTTGS